MDVPNKKQVPKTIIPKVESEDILEQFDKRNRDAGENQFRNILIQAPGIFFVLGSWPEMKFEFANDAALNTLDKTKEIIGKPLFEAIPEAIDQQFPKLLEEVYATGKPYSGAEERAFVLRDGKIFDRYLNYLLQPVFDEKGKVNSVTVIATDVTEQVVARKKIEDSEKRYNMMLMQSPFAFAVFKGEDLIIEMANDSMKEVLGKGKDIEDKPLLKVLPELVGQPFPDYLRDVMKTGKAFTANETLCLLWRNGRMEDAYFSFVYQPYWEADGRISGIACIAYEVTNEVIAKRRLEENAVVNSKLAAIIYSTEDAIISKTLESVVTSWNPAAEKMFGYKASEMIGQAITKIIPPDRLKEEPEILKRIHNGETVNHFETKRLTKDGKLIDLSITISPLRDNEGNIIGASKIARDITKTKQIQDAIKESEHRYRELTQSLEKKVSERTRELTIQKDFLNTIINSTPVLIGAYDTKLRIIAFNKACEDVMGIKQEDVIGRTYAEVFPGGVGSKGYNDLLLALKGETIKNDVYFSEQARRYFQNIITPLKDENNEVYAVVGIAHDITELMQYTEKIQQSEEKFNKLFSASPLGMTLTEYPSGRAVDVNDVHLRMVGYKKEEYIGKTALELNMIDNDDRQRIVDELEENGFVKNFEITIRKKSGERVPVLNSIELISIGNKKYYLSAIIDISDRKKAEQDIQQVNTELSKMNKELESFAYVSSHDLQEPLRKIQTFANRLLDKETENLSEKGKDYFRRMVESANRMQTLIDDLLSFSRINTTERKFESINLSNIIRDVLKEYREAIKEKQADIQVGEMCELKIIAFQFRQLFDNLFSNSFKFANPNEQLRIKVESQILDADNYILPVKCKKVCKITFTDNGIGFESQFKDRIFDMFQRLHGKSEFPGTGIGLSIVKKVVEVHHGRIEAESAPGKGAVFTVYLPVDDQIMLDKN